MLHFECLFSKDFDSILYASREYFIFKCKKKCDHDPQRIKVI